MKKVISSLALATLVMLTIVSCQNDSDGTNELTKNSPLTTWLMRVTHTANSAGKSSNDDMPCFAVTLPVTVITNGVSVVISSPADYQLVINAIDEMDEENTTVTFAYPITITFADGTTQTINSDQDLETVYENCDEDEDDNDDIECLDLNFPISISYTDANNAPAVISFNNNDEIYDFLYNLDDNDSYIISYPFTITDGTGASVVINNNDQLENIIENANEECGDGEDHDDDGSNG